MSVLLSNSSQNTIQHLFTNKKRRLRNFQEGIALAKAEIDAIANHPEAPTFENTIVAMDYTGDILDRASSIFF
jgi:peptidyl-dipeptidase Dcp